MISAWDVSGAHLEMVWIESKMYFKKRKINLACQKRDNKNCEEDGWW